MSQLDLGTVQQQPGRRRGRKQSKGCIPVLIAALVIAVIGGLLYVKGVDVVKGWVDGNKAAADYSGDGSGTVTIEVKEGQTATDIAHTLFDAGVVKSVNAFVDAATANPQSTSIQVGFYQLHEKMAAKNALDLILDTKVSMVSNPLTIPEGKRADEIVAAIAETGGFSEKSVQAAYDDTKALGLPSYAGDDPEGFLFPATYNIAPNATPASVLKAMVDEFKNRAAADKLEQGAADLGMSPYDVLTVASLVQAEASRPQDLAKVASVIYNRLDAGMPLQLDSTLHYAVDSRGVIGAGDLTQIDSPYNTYQNTGLPPTPIDSPGDDAINAALHPANTTYLYFVTINLRTGKTLFANTYAEHQQNVDILHQYCETSDEC
ncbi:MAG TPA: endolytic transglycosylase MltG [Nocardioidaceae bacterium]|nr:endolytic transglycosylase MltG [Nocardioidaceae bacterium]